MTMTMSSFTKEEQKITGNCSIQSFVYFANFVHYFSTMFMKLPSSTMCTCSTLCTGNRGGIRHLSMGQLTIITLTLRVPSRVPINTVAIETLVAGCLAAPVKEGCEASGPLDNTHPVITTCANLLAAIDPSCCHYHLPLFSSQLVAICQWVTFAMTLSDPRRLLVQLLEIHLAIAIWLKCNQLTAVALAVPPPVLCKRFDIA